MTINGTHYTGEVAPRTLLSDFIRHQAGLTGTHVGCEHGVCGACTVQLDGDPVRSCLMLAVQADGRSLTTVEGLGGPDGQLSDLQRAFTEHHALQCGFCTSGFLITADALLRTHARAERDRGPRGDRRQPLPLHGLRGDRGGDPLGRRSVFRRSVARPAGPAGALASPPGRRRPGRC